MTDFPATEETVRRLTALLERAVVLLERIARGTDDEAYERGERGGPPRRSVTTPPIFYYSVPQVAAMLQVNEKTVRSDIRAGRLPAKRVGSKGHYRVPADAIPGLPPAGEPPAEVVTRRTARPRAAKVERGRFR
jgi:excisionase family DNA binding protein